MCECKTRCIVKLHTRTPPCKKKYWLPTCAPHPRQINVGLCGKAVAKRKTCVLTRYPLTTLYGKGWGAEIAEVTTFFRTGLKGKTVRSTIALQ